ncbi:MAG: hypothetical protein ABII97_01400 [Patescibacteria group bacterium]
MVNKKTHAEGALKWTTYEHDHVPKDANWFWLVGSGTIFLVLTAILLQNFLFGVLSVVAAVSVILVGTKNPRRVTFSLEVKGIKVGREFFPYDEINTFWIHYDPPHKKELVINPQKKLGRNIKIPLGDTDPNEARDFLKKVLKEERQEEPLTEIVANWLGF